MINGLFAASTGIFVYIYICRTKKSCSENNVLDSSAKAGFYQSLDYGHLSRQKACYLKPLLCGTNC